jgi:hypothetical protein
MKKLPHYLLVLALLSCHPKSNQPAKKMSAAELKSEYLKKALQSDSYKNASGNIQRVKDVLDSVKKGSLDSNAAIFVFNNSIATPATQVKTIAQVKEGIKNDSAYLKAAQLKAAADLAHEDSLSKIKH